MKKIFATCIFAMGALAVGAKTPEWLDPNVNAINRAPMHTAYFAYESEDLADGCKSKSANYLPLDGTWKFFYVPDADKRLTWRTHVHGQSQLRRL